MHLRNSWTRLASSWEKVQSVSFLGLNGGIFLLTSKFQETSQTRSLMTGKAFMGRTVIGSQAVYLSIRSMHISRGLPLTSPLHEPHLPALQFQRQARSGACSACTLWMASRTTMPGCRGTLYSTMAPDSGSPGRC